MSYFDYEVSRTIVMYDFPFFALVMAAMRQADTGNLTALREGFPDVWAELDARYNAPGGFLEGEPRS